MFLKLVSSLTHFDIKGLICDKNSRESLLISQKDVIVMLVFVCVSVCLYVIMYMCVSSPVSHHNFVKWDPIVTTLYNCYKYGDTRVFYVISREISGVSGYVKGQGQGHQKHECTDWAVTFEPDVVETSGWLHFVPYWKSHL